MKKQCRGNEQALKKGGRGSQHTSMVQESGYFDGLLLKQYQIRTAEYSFSSWVVHEEIVCTYSYQFGNNFVPLH